MSAAPALLDGAMDARAFAALAGADAAQVADLEAFRRLLEDWNGRMNLVGASTLADFWSRHAWDSAQLLKLAPDARTWADLGAGAGLPGVVLAILLKGRTDAKVHLIESMAKRCRFLAEVAAALSLPVEVHNRRAEELKLTVDVVTARACAPLSRLLRFAQPYMARGAKALFLKGQDAEAEIKDARRAWRFDVDVIPSLSDPRGRILKVERLARGP
ncbi:MAG TPA: 16S rRNA (guanine(527)-N(7))-methyltransferase RsmG [Caulobacteraceae bacterium]|jgi:16S rRNA (guanine527-N7)-methyltransferase|nr:16S rRNA (guanine(527)-N(7))-methyltransferase RsmG [Caulobacteraceae bacterium]